MATVNSKTAVVAITPISLDGTSTKLLSFWPWLFLPDSEGCAINQLSARRLVLESGLHFQHRVQLTASFLFPFSSNDGLFLLLFFFLLFGFALQLGSLDFSLTACLADFICTSGSDRKLPPKRLCFSKSSKETTALRSVGQTSGRFRAFVMR